MRATLRFGAWLAGGLLLVPSMAYAQDKAQARSQPAQAAPAHAAPAPPPPPPPPPARTAPPPTAMRSPSSAPARVSQPVHAVPREGAMPRSVMRDPAFGGSAARQEQARTRDRSTAQPAGERAVTRDTPRATGGPWNGNDTAVRSERPRGDRPSYGTAVDRKYPPHHGGGGGGGYWGPWWDPYPYSFGYLGWDPFWWGGGYPAYPTYQAYAPPVGYLTGGIRLKVKPKEAEVYVDGYYAGTVDEYDGAFQKLTVATGPHHIQIQAPGFQPLDFDVNLQPDQNITYKGEMQPQ